MGPAPAGREVGRTVADHGTPFFLSYARAREGAGNPGAARFSDLMAERFYFDLSENVGQLIIRETGADIGFMDTGMQGGMHWVDELLHAAGTCQMLIPLLSVPYLSREWCGMEWYAFSQRSVQRLAGAFPNQGWIIPVRWAPVPPELPSPVSDEMIFSPTGKPDPELPAQYEVNGVYGLLRMGQEDSYQIIVWQLAMLVAKIYHSQRLKARRFRLEELQNAFQGAPR
jgi:hypothetical protein